MVGRWDGKERRGEKDWEGWDRGGKRRRGEGEEEEERKRRVRDEKSIV